MPGIRAIALRDLHPRVPKDTIGEYDGSEGADWYVRFPGARLRCSHGDVREVGQIEVMAIRFANLPIQIRVTIECPPEASADPRDRVAALVARALSDPARARQLLELVDSRLNLVDVLVVG